MGVSFYHYLRNYNKKNLQIFAISIGISPYHFKFNYIYFAKEKEMFTIKYLFPTPYHIPKDKERE
jgi:hypothetical protein